MDKQDELNDLIGDNRIDADTMRQLSGLAADTLCADLDAGMVAICVAKPVGELDGGGTLMMRTLVVSGHLPREYVAQCLDEMAAQVRYEDPQNVEPSIREPDVRASVQ